MTRTAVQSSLIIPHPNHGPAAIKLSYGEPLGVVVGALMPTGGWHDVYRAR
jgi:hypothetical protein